VTGRTLLGARLLHASAQTPMLIPPFVQSFADWASFGGWTKPAAKQFNDGPAVRLSSLIAARDHHASRALAEL